jgi:hypothetical protein
MIPSRSKENKILVETMADENLALHFRARRVEEPLIETPRIKRVIATL